MPADSLRVAAMTPEHAGEVLEISRLGIDEEPAWRCSTR
ncbi:hypothetical protein BJ982_005176 [Sphaerisporangium siamense]|uniref:Uncharacterized protein n=1 Tax=Sphaerisporangium siamense TaxID=795645 RepID=A0A7W7DB82_9ACTN|nr:hypothetical protein [Sphaerisporangium siamense]